MSFLHFQLSKKIAKGCTTRGGSVFLYGLSLNRVNNSNNIS